MIKRMIKRLIKGKARLIKRKTRSKLIILNENVQAKDIQTVDDEIKDDKANNNKLES